MTNPILWLGLAAYALIGLASLARAEKTPSKNPDVFVSKPVEISKLEAMRLLIDKKEVYRCKKVELSDKLTIRNVK